MILVRTVLFIATVIFTPVLIATAILTILMGVVFPISAYGQAASDSISGYWQDLDDSWLENLPSDLLTVDLPAAAIDSLTQVGDEKVEALLAGRLWRFSFNPIGRLWYNRVEGFRLGVTGGVYLLGPARPKLNLGLGYGFSSSDWIYDSTLTLPLVRKRRQLEDGMPVGRPWALWEVELAGGRYVRRFGGDNRWVRSYTAFLYGADPNQYLNSEAGHADLRFRPWRWLTLEGGVLVDVNHPMPVATNWNLFGQDVDDNLQAIPLRTEALTSSLSVAKGRWRVWANVQWHRVTDSPLLDLNTDNGAAPDRLDYRRACAGLSGGILDKFGNEYLVKLQGEVWDRQVPVQWKTFLGDYPTLRGYTARALAGEEAVWASLDVRFGFDLFRAIKFPWLKKLGLQPLVLFDWGRANALAGPEPQPWETGWRANAGFGFGKLLGLPGAKGNVRLYVSHPVLDGNSDAPWRVLLVFEDY